MSERERARQEYSEAPLIGRSPVFCRLLDQIGKVSLTDHPVALVGPRGSGKTTLAQYVHETSRRRRGPYRRLHCAKIPPTLVESELFGTTRGAFSGAADREGLIAAASGGTLFVDSLESCPLDVQAKLLDALEGHSYRRLGANREHRVDVRWVVATNEDPETLLQQGRLRPDVWDRIAVQVLNLPPLAGRPEDVPILAMHFLERERLDNPELGAVSGFEPAALDALCGYAWPGNVRELMNVVRRLVTIAGAEFITAEDVAVAFGSGAGRRSPADPLQRMLEMPYIEARKAFEHLYVRRRLEDCGGNVADAASHSGISRRALYQILERHRDRTE
ncbi:MAG: sigma 54-interacting transcriptional regulator [Acidobacteriota bacterium]